LSEQASEHIAALGNVSAQVERLSHLFDDNARLDEEFFGAGKECQGCEQEFFPAGHVKSNFFCNLGYGDSSKLYPRALRLEFNEAGTLL